MAVSKPKKLALPPKVGQRLVYDDGRRSTGKVVGVSSLSMHVLFDDSMEPTREPRRPLWMMVKAIPTAIPLPPQNQMTPVPAARIPPRSFLTHPSRSLSRPRPGRSISRSTPRSGSPDEGRHPPVSDEPTLVSLSGLVRNITWD